MLALLAGALGGMGGGTCAIAGTMLLGGMGDVAALVGPGVFGLSGGGLVALWFTKYYLRASWREAASRMRTSFGIIAVLALGVVALLTGVRLWRHLVLPESAALLTAVLLAGAPAIGGLAAALVSTAMIAGRRRA
jgi:hypothetical protein